MTQTFVPIKNRDSCAGVFLKGIRLDSRIYKGNITSPGECADFDKECGGIFTIATCKSHPELMEKKCPKMCNLCSKLFNVDSLVNS